MDFDLDDLISSDAANNAKVNTKFQPKAKPKPKPKPKTQPGPRSAPIPSTQSVEAATAASNEFTGRTEEEHTVNNAKQISGNINDKWQSFIEKSQQENAESYFPSDSLNDSFPQSTTATVNSPPCSEAPTIHAPIEGNLEKGSIETELSNDIDACTNLESLSQIDPLTGEEASILNDNDFQRGDFAPESKDAESSVFREPLDILFMSKVSSGPRVGKFKPKPKAQTRKLEHTSPNHDVVSASYGQNTHSVPSQTDYMENEPFPSVSDIHVNEGPINLTEVSQVDSVISEERLDFVPETLSPGPKNGKKGKRQIRKKMNLTQQDKPSETGLENQTGGSSGRPRRQANKTLELIDEGVDDDSLHGNEDNDDNDGGYEPENDALSIKKGNKSKKPDNEKEKTVRKRKKANDVPNETTKVAKKKFSHYSRRNKRQVNPDLLTIPEDELELHNVPMKELIRLAEHRERIAKKEASTSGTPAINPSASSFSNHYNDGEGTGSVYEHEYSMDGQNATYYNYRTHMKITPRMKWSKQDTELFYQAVQQFGTDLSMIKECFPGRTREQIKSKYKREERQQPSRLNDALTTRARGHSHFEDVIKRLKQAHGQESDNPTGEEDEEMVAADTNEAADTRKAEEFDKQVKEKEPQSPTKSHDSEDDMFLCSQYKCEI